MAKKTKRRTSNKNPDGSASQTSTPARRNNQPERTTLFVPSTHPRVTTCEAWKSAMQFRHELLTNPRQDSGTGGYWSVWVGTLQRWLYGGGNWGDGYYAPSHRITTPDAAVSLKSVKETRDQLGRATSKQRKPLRTDPGDNERTMFFPAGSTYFYDGPVIDWSGPFPAIANRAPLVEWLESWIDRITVTEATGRYPWEPAPTGDEVRHPEWLGLLEALDAKIARETIRKPARKRAATIAKQAAPTVDDMRELSWFTGATRGGLTGNALRQALNRKSEAERKQWHATRRNGKRWWVSAMAVANDPTYHQYRQLILDQLERDKTIPVYRRKDGKVVG
jgi:hypothetical protein